MRKKHVQGFTLVELMVSITIFLIITLSVMGLITTMFASQRKVQQEQDFVVNLSESLFSLKSFMRPYTGFKTKDIQAPQNFTFTTEGGDSCGVGYSESIAMLDANDRDTEGNAKVYYLTTERAKVYYKANDGTLTEDLHQKSVRLILATQKQLNEGGSDVTDLPLVVLPLIKDFTVLSVCFKTAGVETESQLSTVHPRVTVIIKAKTNIKGPLPVPDPNKIKKYTFQFTVESRNITNIQNKYQQVVIP